MLGDPMPYVTQEEKDAFVDCTVAYREKLVSEGVLSDDAADDLVTSCKDRVSRAIAFAEQSPYPDPSEALNNQYAV